MIFMKKQINPEILIGLGAKKDKKDNRDFRLSGIMAAAPIPQQKFELPEVFSSNHQWGRGSCTAQSQAHHKERQENVQMSARFVMAKTKELEQNTEYGAYTRNTFKIVNNVGVCEEDLYPEPEPEMSWEEYINVAKIPSECYNDAIGHKSQSYWRLDNNIDMIRQTLVEKGVSVVMSMEWFRNFNTPDAYGFLPFDTGDSVGGHAVEICGFDDSLSYLLLKNSWGPTWGYHGFFKIPYKMFPDIVWDCWSSLDMPVEYSVDKRYGQERTWDSYLREKAIAFNPWLINKIGRLPNNREINGLVYGYYEWEAVFRGKYGDLWLNMTKPEAKKKGLI